MALDFDSEFSLIGILKHFEELESLITMNFDENLKKLMQILPKLQDLQICIDTHVNVAEVIVNDKHVFSSYAPYKKLLTFSFHFKEATMCDAFRIVFDQFIGAVLYLITDTAHIFIQLYWIVLNRIYQILQHKNENVEDEQIQKKIW